MNDTMSDISFCEVAKIDEAAPDFSLPAYNPLEDNDTMVHLADLKGKWVVLFAYPADFTFVCPTELKDMTDSQAKFKELNVEVLSLSTDTVFSHKAWIKQESLMKDFPYKMLADHTLEVSDAYNILDYKSGMAGRGTFIIDPEGIIRGIEITSGPLGRNSEELIRKIEALQHMAANPGIACPARWNKGSKTLTPSIKISGNVGEQLS